MDYDRKVAKIIEKKTHLVGE